jgi:hypothetical protein
VIFVDENGEGPGARLRRQRNEKPDAEPAVAGVRPAGVHRPADALSAIVPANTSLVDLVRFRG